MGFAGAGAYYWCALAPRPINETKLAIVAAMEGFARPVTSTELYGVLDGKKSLKAIEYHLSTLAKAGAVKVIVDPDELRFSLR